MAQHKWHKEIKAWADGAEIEWKNLSGNWINDNYPSWDITQEFRIKPQPKEPQYLYIWEMAGVIYLTKHKHEGKNYAFIGKIKLEVDDE